MRHISRLEDIKYDPVMLKQGLQQILGICDWHQSHSQIGLTHALGPNARAAWHDAAGSLIFEWGPSAYDSDGQLMKRTTMRKEEDFVHFVSEFDHTVFRQIFDQLRDRFRLGRVRLMMSKPRTCLSWHTDAQRRLHIPIITNEGARLVIEDEANHLPADGSVYIANTLLPHTAFNSGHQPRIHLVAALIED